MLEAEAREAHGDLKQAPEETPKATLRHHQAKEALEATVGRGILAG